MAVVHHAEHVAERADDRRRDEPGAALDGEELLDLLLSLAIAERLRSPLLLSTVAGLRQKL
nr:hypothetical protein [Nannocystis exedens]